ncbi:hypothetical protein IM660_04725 [Ruania alkalisoli]|uniref:LPXTG cell wall anchor domain-containing protein n=1 Tax=Ruania alkalisoli TaxID=2779775 RepID=A0A7M1SYD9_9MICO|nr:hypothetical protein IM660_04725 [Ruania alkalisoli]
MPTTGAAGLMGVTGLALALLLGGVLIRRRMTAS